MPTHLAFARLVLPLIACVATAGSVHAAGTAAAGSTAPAAPAATAAAGASDHYFRMKQVQLMDQTQQPPKPAFDLMIPTTWQWKGWVNVGVAEGGCFADWFSVVGDAKNEDGTVELQMLPQMTWQYVTDPQAQQFIQKQNDSGLRFKIKPCPLRMPVHAADFLRHDLLDRYRKGKTVISIDPFPELNLIARQRLGLPPDGTGNPGGVHTEAARARLAFDDDKGNPVEEWVTAVIVVRALQSSRGVAYDWHATNIMNLRTPKGQLDANDRLFKLIASTIHPDPEWQKYSSGVIGTLYRKKQEEAAKQSQIIEEFQQHVADTINGVVANQQRGSYNSAYGADQGIRGVQTFRDPSSGATYEMSNQYDHAWLNGSNEYVMSDDPNFNPNGQLNGNWNSLQVVRPAP